MAERNRQIDQIITPEIRGSLREVMQTSSWETLETLHVPAAYVNLVEVERDLLEPPEAYEIRIQSFTKKLAERREELSRVNPNSTYVIHEDTRGLEPTGKSALFEVYPDGSSKRVMWDGRTISLQVGGARWEEDRFVVPVYPIDYSESVASENFRYARKFREKGLPVPHAGIGMSVLMETVDGFIPLTRRGIETPVYPGMLYSPGGGPKPGQNSTEALFSEILEETGLKEGEHFDPSQMIMLSLVQDSHFAGSEHIRPELVAYLPLAITFKEVESIQYERAIRKGLKEEDVWALEAISTSFPSLVRKLIYDGLQMCPPTEAGLAHFSFFNVLRSEGLEQALSNAEVLMSRLESYKRSTYTPPVNRLPSLTI